MTELDSTPEGPWVHRGITVSCVTHLPDDLTERLWTLYEQAFAPLRPLAAARQVLTPDEFRAEMSDPRIWKYLAHDRHGHHIGITTLTDELAAVPWISAEFFAQRFPEAWRRRGVFYLGFSLVAPESREHHVLDAMLRSVSARVMERRGVCAYDVCMFNRVTYPLGRRVQRLLNRFGQYSVELLDTQSYYAAISGQDA